MPSWQADLTFLLGWWSRVPAKSHVSDGGWSQPLSHRFGDFILWVFPKIVGFPQMDGL